MDLIKTDDNNDDVRVHIKVCLLMFTYGSLNEKSRDKRTLKS